MRVRSCVALALLIPLSLSVAFAQAPVGIKTTLEEKYKANNARRVQLNFGELKAEAKDKSIAAAVAQWYIYRTSHKFENHSAIQNEFAKEINGLMSNQKMAAKRPYIDMLARECIDAMKLVLDKREVTTDPTTIVQASMLLPTIAKLKNEDVNAYLDSLIADPKVNDVIRLHALKGLRETMPIRLQLDPILFNAQSEREDFKDKKQNLDRARDTQDIDTLTKYIERKVKIDNTAADDAATVRFIRREAILALAAAGSPAVSAMTKPKAEAGFVAPTLMRVIAKNGGLSPRPNLSEKVEAALGLCMLEYNNMPEYNADLGVYYVAVAILDLTNEYNKDWSTFVRVNKDKLPAYHPFKSDARRFLTGLDKLSANANNRDNKQPAAYKAAELLKQTARPLLDKIITYEQTNLAQLEELNRVLGQLRPKSGASFKTLKSAEVPE